MKTLQFNVTGSMQVPDDVIFHYDVAGKLYAYENDGVMYMLQMCFVAESSDGEYEMVHQYDEMENHNIKNVRYDDAEFQEIK
jgi:hypothetical protein